MIKDWKKITGKNSHGDTLIEYRNKKDKSEYFLQYKGRSHPSHKYVWVLEYIRDKKGFLIDKEFKSKSSATQFAKSYMRKH